MSRRHTTTVSALLLGVSALAGCSGSDSDTSSGDGDVAAEAPVAAPDVSDAALRISDADPSIDTATAECIVASMVADGTIGMGEVNTMNFIDLPSNADRLQDAYAAGVDAC